MRSGLLNKKIPTIFALFVLMIGIGIALFVTSNTTVFQGQAAPEDEPKNIRISNVDANSFTVSFVTDTAVLATASYGTSSTDLSQVASGGNTPTTTHVITLSNLTPETSYSFKIISGKSEYSDGGSPFVTSTASELTEDPGNQVIKGTVLAEGGVPAANALVYLTSDEASTISTLTAKDGSFTLNAAKLLTSDLSSYFQLNDDTNLLLTALNQNAQLTAAFPKSQGNPLPPVTLGQSYNFNLASSPQASSSAEEIDFPIFSRTATEDRVVNIQTPEANEGFSDQQPEFQGTALPNEKVDITIQSSQEIITSVTADSSGNWEYRPETPLEPGEHTITIKTRDENGILRILTRPFTVYAQGSQFTEPSVSPKAPTVTPTVTAPISPTTSPTTTQVSPTISPTPTVIIPTQTPMPTAFATPTPPPDVEPTGPTNIPLVIVTSVVILLSGMFFYFLTKINSV